MKAKKFSFSQTNKLDLDTKKIFKYPTPTKLMEVSLMKVNGRHPKNENKYLIEHDCQFVIYVTKGKGKVYAGEEIFRVKTGDVVFVPTENKFAVEGSLEYVTVDVPAFYLEQSEEIKVK